MKLLNNLWGHSHQLTQIHWLACTYNTWLGTWHSLGHNETSLWFQGSQSFSGSSDFLGETGNDTAGGIVLVQSVRQLLAGCLQLLAQSEAVQHDCIPLILQGFQNGRDAGG